MKNISIIARNAYRIIFFFAFFVFSVFLEFFFSQVQTAVFAHFACYYYLICMYIYRYIYMCILLVSWG